MQFLDPALKGMKENGCLFATFSGRNLSGSNLLGLSHTSGFLCKSYIKIHMSAPLGMVYPDWVLMSSPASLLIIGTLGYSLMVSLMHLSIKVSSCRSENVGCLPESPRISIISLYTSSCKRKVLLKWFGADNALFRYLDLFFVRQGHQGVTDGHRRGILSLKETVQI